MTDKDQCRHPEVWRTKAALALCERFNRLIPDGSYTLGEALEDIDAIIASAPLPAAWSHQSAALAATEAENEVLREKNFAMNATIAAAQEREAKIIQAALVQMDSITKQSFKDAIAALSQPSQAPAQGEPAIPFGDYEGGWKVDPAYLSKVQDWIERQDEYPPGWEVIESVFRAHQALAAAPKEHDHDQ